ncbi:hypothetical protein HELRODRAFT_160528 [Helobdella robusta]|uniref:Uncharacterized protein n=1 Tax=Helobdella robusta TaxID=6412 RepID=T1EQD1_HELRO|nr:hypothetical protein HELRODRAFT_160528 [Helobdella robusta]ESO06361.1 hypothetical protein HELRODRAFT_160528 [Helobdella robusta]
MSHYDTKFDHYQYAKSKLVDKKFKKTVQRVLVALSFKTPKRPSSASSSSSNSDLMAHQIPPSCSRPTTLDLKPPSNTHKCSWKNKKSAPCTCEVACRSFNTDLSIDYHADYQATHMPTDHVGQQSDRRLYGTCLSGLIAKLERNYQSLKTHSSF